MGRQQFFQQIVLEYLNVCTQKNEAGALTHIIHKDELKMDHGPKCKSYITKLLRRNYSSEAL